jgi:hypothetical protein
MISVPDEMLMAYADGELAPAETQALESLLGQDPALRARLEPFVETRTRLSSVFEASLHEPIPDRLIAAIARATPVTKTRPKSASVSFGTGLRQMLDAAATAIFPHGLSHAALASVAALLCAGTAAGYLAGRSSEPSQALVETASTNLGLVATGTLARALETNPSQTVLRDDRLGASIVPIVSFRSHDAGVCREYRIARTATGQDTTGADFAGVACRTQDGQWRVALHTETPVQTAPSGSGPHQTATAGNVPAVDALVDTLISGDALGASDEAALLKGGWTKADSARH